MLLTQTPYYNYTEYSDLITNLLAENKTTGDNHSDAMINYTKMNQTRMKRLEKTGNYDLTFLQHLEPLRGQIWYVITEAWCGDAAQNLPWIKKIADYLGNDLRLILRDENLEIMDQFLTNGGRSIPKLVALKNDAILFTWGPRPEKIQIQYKEWLQNFTKEEASIALHKLYTANKGLELSNDFIKITESFTVGKS